MAALVPDLVASLAASAISITPSQVPRSVLAPRPAAPTRERRGLRAQVYVDAADFQRSGQNTIIYFRVVPPLPPAR